MILPSPQMYCEAEIIGDKIFVVGEWPGEEVLIRHKFHQAWFKFTISQTTHGSAVAVCSH